MVPGLKKTATLINQSNHVLFEGLSSGPFTLGADGIPTAPFRASITVLESGDHGVCSGLLTFGAEALAFSNPGENMTTEKSLTAWPAITSEGLDCYILIEALGVNGQPLLVEEAEEIKISNKLKYRKGRDSLGNFTVPELVGMTIASNIGPNSFLEINDIRYSVFELQELAKKNLKKFILRQ